MTVQQILLKPDDLNFPEGINKERYDLAIIFGNNAQLKNQAITTQVNEKLNATHKVFCSTSGHVLSDEIFDDELVVNLLSFDNTPIECHRLNIKNYEKDKSAGSALMDMISKNSLNHILLFMDGQLINGDKMLEGFIDDMPEGVTISGGIAGDGYRFTSTYLGLNANPDNGEIVAVAFYGDQLRVSSAYESGFQSFGPQRKVTDSNLNILKSLDSRPALDLYKEYLGDLADHLPGTALYFPIAIYDDNGKIDRVRTILNVDDKAETMTFAGNMPKDATVSLMRANVENLVDASETVLDKTPEKELSNPEFIMVTSCVGRRIVMEERVNEELSLVRSQFPDSKLTGFYSYGEICTDYNHKQPLLHNQTIIVTMFQELTA